MWIQRFYQNQFFNYLEPGKVTLLYGPRRTGKTSLVQHVLANEKGRIFQGAGEDQLLKDLFRPIQISRIRSAFEGYSIVFIDEAQKIPDVGNCLKVLVDHVKNVRVIASGSSSFQLSATVGEPLTGRQRTLFLYPLSIIELKSQFGGMYVLESLENYLITGMYPEVLTLANNSDRIDYLSTLRDSYLFRDILELENIRNSDKLADLLRLLAFQIGKEVSLNELSNSLGLAKKTVERYLDLLEKSFVIKKVRGFSRNLRKEISTSCRYYFVDNGIRNALINNFNPLSMRNDIGMLWENFLFMERMKKLHYNRIHSNIYFWRTYDRREIDLVEERNGRLYGYELKWGKGREKQIKLWTDSYKNASLEFITRENFLEFIT
ncbi:MAG: ATP-binding protein [Acidobacteria bacterium]|nr:ATP-binding protein [Acidobacteriota bacterium]